MLEGIFLTRPGADQLGAAAVEHQCYAAVRPAFAALAVSKGPQLVVGQVTAALPFRRGVTPPQAQQQLVCSEYVSIVIGCLRKTEDR